MVWSSSWDSRLVKSTLMVPGGYKRRPVLWHAKRKIACLRTPILSGTTVKRLSIRCSEVKEKTCPLACDSKILTSTINRMPMDERWNAGPHD